VRYSIGGFQAVTHYRVPRRDAPHPSLVAFFWRSDATALRRLLRAVCTLHCCHAAYLTSASGASRRAGGGRTILPRAAPVPPICYCASLYLLSLRADVGGFRGALRSCLSG